MLEVSVINKMKIKIYNVSTDHSASANAVKVRYSAVSLETSGPRPF